VPFLFTSFRVNSVAHHQVSGGHDWAISRRRANSVLRLRRRSISASVDVREVLADELLGVIDQLARSDFRAGAPEDLHPGTDRPEPVTKRLRDLGHDQ
jgi:hypothetical protein